MLVFSLVICLIIIGCLIVVVIWQYNSYTLPVKNIRQAAQKLYEGDYSSRIFVHNRNETGKICVLINKIADQHLSLEQQLDDKTKELERTTKSLDNFAYVVSHDLKAPFNSIKSISELLRLEYGEKFDESGKELLNFIDIKVNEMDRLLMGILLYSRVRQSEEKVEHVELNSEVKKVIEEVNPPDHIQVTIENDLPFLNIERELIHKVFFNLIDNAVRYMDKKNGRVQIGSDSHDQLHTFYVKDNGKGIQSKYFDKIFNIFYMIREEDNGEHAGNGVGLSIVKKVIEYKGGQIWVDSEPGLGSTFFFTLPAN